MRENNNEIINQNNILRLNKPNIKCLLAFTIIFSFNEIIYIILLYISNDLYKISFILDIINFILIFCLITCNLYLIPYQDIRISLNLQKFAGIEEKLTFASMIFSISIAIMSFLANFLYKFIQINNPLCPYFNFCELKIYSNNYNYFCNYKPIKISNYIDINSCQDISNNIPYFLKNCENKYKCELAATEVEEENTASFKIFTLVLGIILFLFWLTIMVFWIYNFKDSNYKNPGKIRRIKLYIVLKSEDSYCYLLCEHNPIKDKFSFKYDDIGIEICEKCKNSYNEDSVRLDNRNNINSENNMNRITNEEVQIYTATDRNFNNDNQ